MKISKQARRDARELFRACCPDVLLDEARVRQALRQVLATRPRGYLAILSHFRRLVKLDLDRRTARIESATPLSAAQQAALQARLTSRYGPGLIFTCHPNPGLIGGVRVQVGSDVFDGSIQARLAELEDAF